MDRCLQESSSRTLLVSCSDHFVHAFFKAPWETEVRGSIIVIELQGSRIFRWGVDLSYVGPGTWSGERRETVSNSVPGYCVV